MPGLGRAAAASRPPEQFLRVCSSLAANYPSPAPTHTRKLSSAAPDMRGHSTQQYTYIGVARSSYLLWWTLSLPLFPHCVARSR